MIPLNSTYTIVALLQDPETNDPINATGNVVLKIFGAGNAAAVFTVNMTRNTIDGALGIYFADVTVSVANGFAVGTVYTPVVSATVTSVSSAEFASRETLPVFRVVAAEGTAGLPKVDTQRMNGADVLGSGTSDDKWRGA